MENNENRSPLNVRISRRAQLLALRNNVEIHGLVGTGPEGRIIENDILRAIEERNRPVVETAPVEEPAVETAPTEEPAVETAPVEEPAVEEAPVEEPVAEEAPTEEPVAEEPVTEEAPTEEPVAEESVTEEAPTEEPVAEESVTEEAPVEEPAVKEVPVCENAIVAAPVTAVCAEQKEEAEAPHVSENKFERATEAYRHTDVILSPSEDAPDGTPITIGMSFDATAILSLRAKIKDFGEAMGLPSITLNDMILFAVSRTLKKHKALNAHFLGDKIRYFDGVHLSFAVDTECGPEMLTVFDADRLSLSSLSKITGTLVRGVRAGNGSPEKNQRVGSFTVTNVGTLGVETFVPVLKAPQTGILGVCALTTRVKTVDGEDIAYPAIALSLTFEPRAMSTANAAKFLRELCTVLENFGLLLIK